jgi:hypothetical protein
LRDREICWNGWTNAAECVPDLTRTDALIGKRRVGNTNQAVAADLIITDRTARHLSNIVAELGVTLWTAAAEYGFGHGVR